MFIDRKLAGFTFVVAIAVATASGCKPEVGSDAWCKNLAATPKVDWSMRDATDYTKYCVLKQNPDQS